MISACCSLFRAGILAAAVVTMALLCGFPRAAQAEFGIEQFDGGLFAADGSSFSQAGGHPDTATTSFLLPERGLYAPDGQMKDVYVDLPPGFVANPTITPATCSRGELIGQTFARCPVASQVGTAKITLADPNDLPFSSFVVGVYNLTPARGHPAEVGMNILRVPIILTPALRVDGDYGLTVASLDTSQSLAVVGTRVTLWGTPADPSHDDERGTESGENSQGVECANVNVSCSNSAGYTPKAFVTNAGECAAGPLTTTLRVNSWEDPSRIFSASFDHDTNGNPTAVTGCEKVPFDPEIEVEQTSDQAETATGLDFKLDVLVGGLLNPSGVAAAHVKRATVTLPLGTTLNPSSAEGLGVCSPADFKRETAFSDPGAGCPNQSRLGSVDIASPLLKEHLVGSVYLAKQDDPTTTIKGAENPFDSLIAIYVVARSEERGVIVKLAGKVEPDPRTGRLVTTFDDLPQLPFSSFRLRFREGGRAPLVSPPACGTYTTEAEFVPWSAADPDNPTAEEIAHTTSQFKVTRGVGGGPCPSGGVPPFRPSFSAGSLNNNAKSFSPFTMRLTRADGEQDMTRFSSILPPGVLGKLAGVAKCPDQAIAAAKARSGREEIASPSCPASSQIGRILVGAGVGSVLTYVPGKVYLGGPFNGDPLSVVVITPAVAGPFDVGTVVVREALTLDPNTAEVEVDGAASDPIPHILAGIPLKLRDLRVYVDRDSFILNPTNCDPSSVKSTLFGSFLDVFDPADDVPVALQERYQAANCANLGFKPGLRINLKGGTRRGDFPALRAVLNARPGDANIGSATVTLPRSAFLEQGHIRTICTRVQFAADQCPKASVYGHAKAITPLLDEPLSGPVYLRSSNNKLPDLVAALEGIVDIDVVGEIDSFKGGIRSRFPSVPDAPVSKFVLTMQGGRKGLVVNSRNLCARPSRARARFVGQNGKPRSFRPLVRAQCEKRRPKRQR
jgi:hypothetical protein